MDICIYIYTYVLWLYRESMRIHLNLLNINPLSLTPSLISRTPWGMDVLNLNFTPCYHTSIPYIMGFEFTKVFKPHTRKHHTVIFVIIIILLQCWFICIILFYHASMLTLPLSSVSHALWLVATSMILHSLGCMMDWISKCVFSWYALVI